MKWLTFLIAWLPIVKRNKELESKVEELEKKCDKLNSDWLGEIENNDILQLIIDGNERVLDQSVKSAYNEGREDGLKENLQSAITEVVLKKAETTADELVKDHLSKEYVSIPGPVSEFSKNINSLNASVEALDEKINATAVK